MHTIYIDVRHMNYWFGLYNFTTKTDWEDIIMYFREEDRFVEITKTCICAKTHFRSGLEDIKKDPSEGDFADKIESFLNGDEIINHYYYDRKEDDDFYEVPFEAKRNSENIKPRWIETWYPCEGIDKEVVDGTVKHHLKKFMNIDVLNVEYKEPYTREETLKSYLEEMELFKDFHGVSYSEELLQMLEKEWEASREKVLRILARSV